MNRHRTISSWIFSVLLLFLLVTSTTFAELINDGSFENIPPDWSVFNNTPCSSIGNWSGVDGAPDNFDGQRTLWVGGVCGNIFRNNGARQTFILQEDVALLSFWYNPVKTVPDSQTVDRAIVSMNGSEIWTLVVEGSTPAANWNNALIDISQFANQTATLTLEMQQNNTNAANVFFDYIEFFHPSIAISQEFTPSVVLVGENFSVTVSIENSGDTLLNNVSVTNSTFSDCDRAAGSLPDLLPGEVTAYTCNVTNASLEMENSASVQATTTEIEYLVEASQTVSAPVANPALGLTVTPEAISVTEGESISLALTLTNSGNVALTNVQISAAQASECNFLRNLLPMGETAVFNCTYTPSHSGIIPFLATAIEPVTGAEAAAETAVSIEIIPIIPPSITTFSQYLPLVTNNLTIHNSLGEPNDVCDLAFPITTNQSGQFLAEDVNDWYQFSLNTTDNITVNLTNFVPIAGQITLWRGNCGSLTFVGQNGDFAATKNISLMNQPPGNYYLWLINDGQANSKDTYTLTVLIP
jgi:hypothetical protein